MGDISNERKEKLGHHYKPIGNRKKLKEDITQMHIRINLYDLIHMKENKNLNLMANNPIFEEKETNNELLSVNICFVGFKFNNRLQKPLYLNSNGF